MDPPLVDNTICQDTNNQAILQVSAKLNDLALSLGKDHLVDLSSVKKELDNQNSNLDNKLSSQDEHIKNISKNIHQKLMEQELNYANVDLSVHPPTSFPPHPTLTDPKRLHEVGKIFPTRDRFTGSSNIFSFLTNLNFAQEIAQLSEKEFREIIHRCFAKLPFIYVEEFLKNNMSTSDIYYNLSNLYDDRQTPEQAKITLSNLKCNRNDKLQKLIGQIMILGGRSASILPEGAARTALYNAECCSALVKILPPNSSSLVSNQLNLLHAKLQKVPSFVEVCKSIKPFSDSIQADINRSGGNDPTNNFKKRFKPSIFQISHEKSDQNSSNHKRVGPFTPKSNFSNQSNNNLVTKSSAKRESTAERQKGQSKQCTLCGRSGHTANDICYKMRTNTNKLVTVIPSYTPCKICLERANTRLFHPEQYCFRRETYPKQNKAFVERSSRKS